MIARVFAATLAGLLGSGCGYHSLKQPDPGGMRVGVVLSKNLTPSSRVAAEVVRSAMGALAKDGVLRAGDPASYPRVEIEVLRIDEAPIGIAASVGVPAARGHEIAVIARGALFAEAGAPAMRDTGDLRAQVVVSRGATLSGADAALEAAEIAAARRVGRMLGESVAGHPVASEEDAP